MTDINKENRSLLKKYKLTSWFYDILDYPWEVQYKKWRPEILKDVRGIVLEAGVGTGRNLPYYSNDVNVTGIDLSADMLRFAEKRSKNAICRITLFQNDAAKLSGIPSDHFNWFISTFMFCVMSDNLQPRAVNQMARILKTGGKFRIIEMVYSKYPKLLRRQKLFSPFVEKVYGARFDRHTLEYLKQNRRLKVTHTRFLKADTYLLIEGIKLE